MSKGPLDSWNGASTSKSLEEFFLNKYKPYVTSDLGELESLVAAIESHPEVNHCAKPAVGQIFGRYLASEDGGMQYIGNALWLLNNYEKYNPLLEGEERLLTVEMGILPMIIADVSMRYITIGYTVKMKREDGTPTGNYSRVQVAYPLSPK